MKRIFDFNAVNWILKNLDHNGTGKVSNLLPDKFDKYIKILMPICIDKSFPIAEYSFKAETIEEINRRVDLWSKYGIINGHPAKQRLERISYKDLSCQLNIPYDKFIDSQSIWNLNKAWPPNLGTLIQEDIKTIEVIINNVGAETLTYFFGDVRDGKGMHENEGIVDWLFRGELLELKTIYAEGNQDFPSYFFAENKEWCFYHPEDESYLLLGCGKTTAQKIMQSESIESFEFFGQEQIINN